MLRSPKNRVELSVHAMPPAVMLCNNDRLLGRQCQVTRPPGSETSRSSWTVTATAVQTLVRLAHAGTGDLLSAM